MKKLYVGNLSYNTSDQDLNELFAKFGQVISANVIRDKYDNSSKGFGFVEMSDAACADKAIDGLNGVDNGGRVLKVNEATERKRDGNGSGQSSRY